jgi:hypothetical protein
MRRNKECDASVFLLTAIILWSLVPAVAPQVFGGESGDGFSTQPLPPTVREHSVIITPPAEDEAHSVTIPARAFHPPDGEKIWSETAARAANPENPAGKPLVYDKLSGSNLVLQGFQWIKGFRRDLFTPTADGSWEMRGFLSAREAKREDEKISLRGLKLVVFLSKDSTHNRKENETSGTAVARRALSVLGLDDGGRVLLEAPTGVFDLARGEGEASGETDAGSAKHVVIEIQALKSDGAGGALKYKTAARFETEKVRWRAFGDPTLGTTELLLYACGPDANRTDPKVYGRIETTAPDGSETTVLLQAEGMIFESADYDVPRPCFDDQKNLAGFSRVRRRRLLFHRDIQAEMRGASLGVMFPFAAATAPNRKDDAQKNQQGRTVIVCEGPAIFDMAVPSRFSAVSSSNDLAAHGKEKNTEIPLARRFIFLNGVRLRRDPIFAAKAAGTSADDRPADQPGSIYLVCRHFCVQFPPGDLGDVSSLPEYAEALDGLHLEGVKETAGRGGETRTKTTTTGGGFQLDGDRLFYDGRADMAYLVGLPDMPVRFRDDEFVRGVRIPWLCYDRRFEVLRMPGKSRKMWRFALPETTPGEGPLPFAGGLMLISCDGESSLEKQPVAPEPGKPPQSRQILTLHDAVKVDAPEAQTLVRADRLRAVLLTRNPGGTNQTVVPESMEAYGNAEYVRGPLRVEGRRILVRLTRDDSGTGSESFVVVGDGPGLRRATIRSDAGAVRAERIEADNGAGTFRAFGGAVIVFDLPASPANETENTGPPVGLPTLKGGDRIRIQCDGPVEYVAAERRLTFHQNVLVEINGEATRLWADVLTLRTTAPPTDEAPAKDVKPAEKSASAKAAKKSAAHAKETKEKTDEFAAFFGGGEPEAVECFGRVEVLTSEQYLRCDRGRLDLKKRTARLGVNDAADAVELFVKQGGGTSLMRIRGEALFRFSDTGLEFLGGEKEIAPFPEEQPLPRRPTVSAVGKE